MSEPKRDGVSIEIVDELIAPVASFIRASGGERVRPALFASAVEAIHAATLAAGDAIDGSELRHGCLASGTAPGTPTTRRWRLRRAPGILSKRLRRRRNAPRSVCCPTTCLPATDET